MTVRNTFSAAFATGRRKAKLTTCLLAAATSAGLGLSAIGSSYEPPRHSPDTQVSGQIMVMFAQETVAKDIGNAQVLTTATAALPFTMRSDRMERRKNPAIEKITASEIGTELANITDIAANLDGVDTIIVPPIDPNASMTHISVLPKERGKAQWQCLAQAIYFEARGEAVMGQRAVAEVILNRVDHRRWPNTVCRVIQQGAHRLNGCQFSYYCDGVPERINNKRAYRLAQKIAKEAIAAKDRPLTKGATHYHATSVSPVWSRRLTKTAQYGTHIFYRTGTRVTRR